MRYKLLIGSLLMAALHPAAASAASCAQVLAPPGSGEIVTLEMAIMSNRGIVSYVNGNLEYLNPVRIRSGPFLPGRWRTPPADPAEQFFADRRLPGLQRFSMFITDDVAIVIRAAAVPTVTVTFLSRNNASLTLTGTCSTGGVIHATFATMDLLIYLVRTRV